MRFNLAQTSTPAAGNSRSMQANSISSLFGMAQQQTQSFIATGKQMAQGASGNSRISIKA
ncbi:MAG: hypothetical protein HQK87_01990 [Nitrospinae bacterium]|nr:hypothetical protein [Nitrospinota bacterium]